MKKIFALIAACAIFASTAIAEDAASIVDKSVSINPPEFTITKISFQFFDKSGKLERDLLVDQYGRNHILFAKDLCLYPYLKALDGATSYRIEAQDYTPEWVGRLTAFYRVVLDVTRKTASKTTTIEEIAAGSPRKLGIGAFRFQD